MARHVKAKVNKTGRNTHSRYTVMTEEVLMSPAFKALSSHAKALYPYIRLYAYGDHNGRVHFSVRTAMEVLNVSKNTANHAFHDLQAKGFIALTEFGVLGVEGKRSSPLYAVTELPIPPNKTAKASYREWRPGHDLPVSMHPTNNPNGWNGKTHLKNWVDLSQNLRRTRKIRLRPS